MLKLGDVVKLKIPCLDNEAGALGIVFTEYNYDTFSGVQVIFENGEYDGFDAIKEQDMFLEFIRHRNDFNYSFQNVNKLTRDFDAGYFIPFIGVRDKHIVLTCPEYSWLWNKKTP